MDMQKMFSLEGKTALVTGGAYGIGFAIAEALAGAGAKIAFNCRSQSNLDKALADYSDCRQGHRRPGLHRRRHV